MESRCFNCALATIFACLLLFHTIEAATTRCITPVVRKEWGSLTKSQRKDYIAAVQCMSKKATRIPHEVVPGARNRHDDFAATHINRTTSVHLDGVFLAWHREFVYLWEQTLRRECDYSGYQPYWDWPLMQSQGKVADSPLFDGSDTSLGGNGYPTTAFNCTVTYIYPNGSTVCLPRSQGGGCMMDGPFVNLTANLGPYQFSLALTGLPSNWTTYNPQCLGRDFNDDITKDLSYARYDSLLTTSDTINDFQNRLSALDGPHTVGHLLLGPAMNDFFSSPYDPAFFLHHGGVDRLWNKWQALDPSRRVYGDNSLYGTSTIFDKNNTPPVNLDTLVTWGYLGRPKTLRELMSVTAGDYCYQYET